MILAQEEIKTLIAPVIRNYPVKTVILFGSYARKEATDGSDVDLMVEGDDSFTGRHLFYLMGDIGKILDKKIGLYDISEILPASDLYNTIKREGVVIYNI